MSVDQTGSIWGTAMRTRSIRIMWRKRRFRFMTVRRRKMRSTRGKSHHWTRTGYGSSISKFDHTPLLEIALVLVPAHGLGYGASIHRQNLSIQIYIRIHIRIHHIHYHHTSSSVLSPTSPPPSSPPGICPKTARSAPNPQIPPSQLNPPVRDQILSRSRRDQWRRRLLIQLLIGGT